MGSNHNISFELRKIKVLDWMGLKLNDCSKGNSLYHSLKNLWSLNLFISLSSLALLFIPLCTFFTRTATKEGKNDIIIIGKTSVYSDKMASTSGRCQISQWPGGIKRTLPIMPGLLEPGTTGEQQGRKEGGFLMPPFPHAAVSIINPLLKTKSFLHFVTKYEKSSRVWYLIH